MTTAGPIGIGGDGDLGAVVVVVARVVDHVERRREVAHDRVHEELHALVLEGGAHEDGDDVATNR